MPTKNSSVEHSITTGFLTRFSLSRKTAIGVQTLYLLSRFSKWKHFYWSTAELDSPDPRSVRLENSLLARIVRTNDLPIIKNLSVWKNDRLTARAEKKFIAASLEVDNWYVAPVESQDSRRMRSLLELVPKPFVVHLWDYLDKRVSEDESLIWLVENATSVAVNSLTLKDEVERLGHPAKLIMFTRAESASTSNYPLGQEKKIALLGNLGSYKEGVRLLVAAVEDLNLRGAGFKLVYMGSAKHLNTIDSKSRARIEPVGWIDSDAHRDELLASCFAGCLPGPYLPADLDTRSRYSIPSRCLDFLAVGLPIIGMVEPSNATARFLKSLGNFGGAYCMDEKSVASFLQSLLDESRWRSESAESKKAFHLFKEEDSAALIGSIIPTGTNIAGELI